MTMLPAALVGAVDRSVARQEEVTDWTSVSPAQLSTARRVEAIRRACTNFLRANGYGFFTAHPLLTLAQLRERLSFAESILTRALAMPMDCRGQSVVPLCGICHVPVHHIVEGIEAIRAIIGAHAALQDEEFIHRCYHFAQEPALRLKCSTCRNPLPILHRADIVRSAPFSRHACSRCDGSPVAVIAGALTGPLCDLCRANACALSVC